MILGFSLLTSSLAGDAAGKIGKNSCEVAEWGSWAGKNTANFVGDTAYGMADSWTTNNWTEKGVIQAAADVTYVTGDIAHATGNLCAASEKVSLGGKNLFAGLEQHSQDLNAYANDLLNVRKNEYRDLDLDFDWRGHQEDGWILVDEFKHPRQQKK
ncbi:MAG: hypothetical protein MRECE_21c008 [Mycoplasmataceae bacterium CE_OT135]|nr:MAG: hypothetical protein MRECE_21c008 [Mycoplasmataceae bacterium CE_OT135]